MADNTAEHMDSLHSFGKSYDVYTTYTTIMPSTGEWLRRNISQVMSDILHKDDKKKMAVLGVGSFNGEQDLIIIDQIDKSLKEEIQLIYTAVEPCVPALDDFEKKIEKISPDMKREITFEKMPVQIETFMERGKTTKEYDLIHFIHCINYMDVEKVLAYCYYNELKDGGKIMIVLPSESSPSKIVLNKFRDIKIPCKFDSYHYYTSDEIEEIARKYDWNVEMFPFSYQIDVTECLTGSDEGDLLTEHLVKGDFRKHATPEIREDLKQVLMELCSETNGRLTEPCDAVIITKNN